jgi:hypothetical protein
MKSLTNELKAMLLFLLAFLFFAAAISIWPFQGKHFASKEASLLFIALGIFSLVMSVKIAGWRAYWDAFKNSQQGFKLKSRMKR